MIVKAGLWHSRTRPKYILEIRAAALQNAAIHCSTGPTVWIRQVKEAKAKSSGGFSRASFQEFLAALRLHRLGGDFPELIGRHAPTRAWHRSLRFLFCAIADRGSPEKALTVLASLLPQLLPAELEQAPAPALLAATALEHDIVLVTRNTKDFAGLPVEVFNPWLA